MAVKYKLTVTVAQEYVKYFTDKNWKICFAKNFQPGNSAVGNVEHSLAARLLVFI